MKKISLFLLTALVSVTATAQRVAIDLTSGWNFPPQSEVIKDSLPHEFTDSTYTITICAQAGKAEDRQIKRYDGALMVGKKGSTITLPIMDFPVGQVVLKGQADGSGTVQFNLFTLVGEGEEAVENEVSTKVTSCKVDQTFAIAEAYQAAGREYYIKVLNAYNYRLSGIEFYEVGAEAVALDSIYLAEKEVAPEYGRTVQLHVCYTPSNTSDKVVSWRSGDATIAKVDKNGLVTAVAVGSTYVYVEKYIKSLERVMTDSCKVTVVAGVLPELEGDVLTGSEVYVSADGRYRDFTDIALQTAVYSGNLMRTKTNSLTLRNGRGSAKEGQRSGIIGAAQEGWFVRAVTIVWDSSVAQEGAEIIILGNKTAYASADSLYSKTAEVKGKELGRIAYNAENPQQSITIEDADYSYIGIRVNSSKAATLLEVGIEWNDVPAPEVSTTIEETYSGCGAAKTLRNGQVVILREGKRYSVLGAEL